MGKQNRIAMFFVVMLCLAGFVYAQDYALFSGKFYDLKEGEEKIEFEFYNGTYSICEEEKKTIPLLIANIGKNDNNYTLNALGASWADLNVKEFSLPKKGSGVVLLGLSPGKGASGVYGLKISAESSFGRVKKDLSLDINVEKCYSLSMDIEKESDKACGGTKKKYAGEVANDGTRKGDVRLILKGPNWVSIDKSAFSVNANGSQRFELEADVPASAKGTFNVFAVAVAENLPSLKSEKSLSIEAVPKYDCHKADIIADAEITNRYSNDYSQIKLRNIGIMQTTYEISLEAPQWVSIWPKKLIVNPEQTGILNLNINPAPETAEGTYAIRVNSKFEDIAYSKDINIVLGKENKFLKWSKSFLIFYKYYIYALLFVAAVLFLFRRQITGKIKAAYRNYKIRQSRLKALEKARKARQEKIKGKKDAKNARRSNATILIFIALVAVASVLANLIEFVRIYYAYIIGGILISFLVIYFIEKR